VLAVLESNLVDFEHSFSRKKFILIIGLDSECYVRMYRFKRLLETRLKEIDTTVEGNKLSREEIEDLKVFF
jgi:hypothetical protein